MIFKVVLLGFFHLVDYASGSCGTCQSNYVACHNETTFSLCVEGAPTDAMVTCPVGTVCTDRSTICVSKDDDSVNESCISGCGICSSYERLFSCLSETTYAFCFGQTEPIYSTRSSCPDGYVCDLSSRAVCVRNTDSTGSCNLDDSSSTTQTPRDASTFCTETATVGTFAAEGDTTCTGYYLCILSHGVYKGYSYKCSTPNFFNAETNLCQRDVPDNCLQLTSA